MYKHRGKNLEQPLYQIAAVGFSAARTVLHTKLQGLQIQWMMELLVTGPTAAKNYLCSSQPEMLNQGSAYLCHVF